MALPLPKVVYDIEPGGGIVTASKGINALQKAELENQYYPTKTMADANSKMTYARLMGPQFMAKAIQNPYFAGNLPDSAAKATVPWIYNAATGNPSTINSFNQSDQTLLQPPQDNSLFGLALRGLTRILGGGQNQPTNALRQQQQSPQIMQLSDGSILRQPNNAMSSIPTYGSNFQSTPEVAQAVANNVPGGSVVIGPNGQPIMIPPSQDTEVSPPREKTYIEKGAAAKGIEKEQEELGTGRGKDITELGTIYSNAIKQSKVFDSLIDLANSPIIQNIKAKNPQVFQDTQMKVLSKIGTPEEKEAIGQFYNDTNEAVKNAINSFQGNKLRGEMDITREMKVSPNDTWNVMVGKLQSAATYNEYDKKLSSLTSQIMKAQHTDRQAALEQADKQLDGKQLRQDIYNRLHPQPTEIDIKHMMDLYKQPRDKIIERLKAKGYKV